MTLSVVHLLKLLIVIKHYLTMAAIISSASSICSSSIPTELVNSVVAFVLNYHGFSLPSASAMKIRELAETVHGTMEE